jgi:iron complex outermembrane receptor protein
MRNTILSLIAGLHVLASGVAVAQETSISIQLLDRTTKTPIAGATYRYNAQHGVSDAQGRVHLEYTPGDTLFLSHIGYGQWYLGGQQLGAAVEAGFSLRARQVVALQPMTVIALRPMGPEVAQLGINAQERLSHDAGAVLNQTAVINSIRKSGSYGFDPVMRGFKYEQLSVVVDGAQSAVAACPNRMDPPTSQVAPNMMEEVEIIKGPHSFRYGTSLGGTINFKSAPHRFSTQQELYGRLSASTESNDGIYRTEGLVGIDGPGYDIAFLGSFSRGADYQDGAAVSIPASFSRASFGSVLGLRPADSQHLSLSITHNRAKDTDFPALPMDLRSDKTWLFNGKHQMSFGGEHLKSWNTSAYVTAVNHSMDNLDKNLDPRSVNAATDADTRSYGFRTEGVWMFASAQLYGGLDSRIDRANGERTREFLMGPMTGNTVTDNAWNGGQVVKGSVFGEYHQSLGAFHLVLSGRLEYNSAEARDVDQGFLVENPDTDASQINLSLSIGGLKDFDNGASVGVWFGRAQRSGSIVERYVNSLPVGLDPYEMLGNPVLDPEVNNQLDLTLSYQTDAAALDVAVFASFLENHISSEIDPDLAPTIPTAPGVKRYVNIEDAFIGGFEMTWVQRLGLGLEHKVDVAFAYGQDRVRDEPLPEIAPLDFRYTLSGSYRDNTLQPMIAVRHVLKQDRISTAFGETRSPSFSVVDLGMTYQIREHLGVSAGVRNLLDEVYYEHLNRSVRGQSSPIRAPGRNLYLSLFMDMM